jgi:FtsZ-binding cell division protein ZapB
VARCPECSTDNDAPTRTWRVIDEPTSTGRFNQRNVGIFQCSRCGTIFPSVVGRRRLAIVDADEYVRIREELDELRAENNRMKEDADLVHLQSSIEALEKEVSALRTEKMELETKLAQETGSLDQVP